jgi:hypothetical protein
MSDWIPGAGVGLIGSAIAWLLSWRIASAKNEGKTEAQEKADVVRAADIRQDLRDMKEDWRTGIASVQKVSDNVLSLQAKQNTVNEFTAKALESLTEKSDRHEQMLADHASTLRLMTDVLMRKKDQQS